VAGTFEPTAGREPTPQYLAELVSKIHEAEVKTIYYEPQMSITGYETFANDYDIELKVLDDIGGVAPYDSYINLIKTNVSTLQNNQ
jgi:ABC-type Zn uptake system ZnuABC Zn-binding protein ZnuA